MYWSPRMHKPPSKPTFIAASACCTTKQLSTTITKCLKLIDQYHEHTARQVYHASGINGYWIINNSSKVHKMTGMSNTSKDVKNLNSYDFSTLYTAIPHAKLKKAMKSIICRAFGAKGNDASACTRHRPHRQITQNRLRKPILNQNSSKWSTFWLIPFTLHVATVPLDRGSVFQWVLTVPHT